jgi:hypothetical protein
LRILPKRIPGEQTTGAAATFDQARADFEDAWKVLLSKRAEGDFQAWRDNRDWTEALILVGRPTMFARIGTMRALNRNVERTFTHWWKAQIEERPMTRPGIRPVTWLAQSPFNSARSVIIELNL